MKKFKFKISGSSYEVDVNEVEGNIIQLEVNGTPYTVELEKEVKKSKTPKLVRSVVQNKPEESVIKKTHTSGAMKVLSPLPGTITQIHVKAGDTVSKGAKLISMEAMKMENSVLAEKAGVVANLKVAIGDNVLQNDVLLEIE